MTGRHLKRIRIGVSAFFLALMAALFLDFRNAFPPEAVQGLLYLQFVPSLLKFIHAAALGAAGFILVLILTALFGRVYCSFVCPLGMLQDVIGAVGGRKRKPRFRPTPPHHLLRLAVLGLTILGLLAGSGLLLNLLDPFSGFGRIFSDLLRPLVIMANNLAAMVLEPLGVHGLYQVRWAVIAPVSVAVTLATLIPVAWLAAKHGRLYCNTICPIGTLLGLISRMAIFQIRIDSAACQGCGRCERVCKAGCIDMANGVVDNSRCIGCYNCLAVCPGEGLRFDRRWKRQNAAPPKPGRRGFILNTTVGLLGIVGLGRQVPPVIQSRPTTIPERVTSPVSPPGSGSVARFTATCTACHLCVSACPSRVLVPSMFEYGASGLMQPRMNFHAGHCNYECTVCLNVCPSGAIRPLDGEEKKLTQLGVAKFIRENCVVYTDNTNCGACSEHCPTKAVHMVPYLNTPEKRLVIPEVDPDICVGCGGCEYACPTKPYKAIYVDGNPVHQRARKPEVKVLDETVDYREDFPF
ncbi:MAG: 4Fe-4S dicluster domain-containing protein [Desulfobacteraceae bacterium]|jgi:ferredoxin|nr:4Fe-4S dicluster domain-containing protein [Desulfobacteraceae bacterium]MDD3992325.1 4Fe-4S dicluster domain-containing protein [Desulfobacteraceae bacterium]